MALNSLVGQVIGGYKVESEIGRGAVGVVYKARDANLQRVVALKVLAPHLTDDAPFQKRFVREARAAAQLSHPNIVTIYQAGEDQGVYFIAMEYVEGKTLAQCMGLAGRFEVSKALDVTLQVAKALAEAHAKGIVHRDINPRNIMVDSTGRVRVLDFGLAKVLQGKTVLTSHGVTPGTPAYMAPEQVNGEEVDQRTDIYSLGATLFEMLTGRVPYWADTALAVMREIAERPFPILSLTNVAPHPVVQLVSKMTNRHPNYRYSLAELLCADIARLLKDPSTVRSQVVLDAKTIEEIVCGPRVGSEESVSPLRATRGKTEPLATSLQQPQAHLDAAGKEEAALSPTGPVQLKRTPSGAPLLGDGAAVQFQPRPVAMAPLSARAPQKAKAGRNFAIAGIGLGLAIVAIAAVLALRGESSAGWISLFNGKDLTGWENFYEPTMHPGTGPWYVVDGAIGTPSQKSLLGTVGTWRDFELQADYRVMPGSNGGIFLRGRIEFQICDEHYGGALEHAAIYRQHPPLLQAANPTGQWNYVEIRFEGDLMTVRLNGRLIHDNVRVRAPEGLWGSPVTAPGPILLQAWEGTVYYKNIRIRPIDGTKSEHAKGALKRGSPSVAPTERGRMDWWREARFGMFVHWGLYSISREKTEQRLEHFSPTQFDADEWVRIAKSAGMKYIVITTKHEDGFCLFDSGLTYYDIMSTPFRRDVMKELADACRRGGMRIGWFYSILDTHHPDYLPRRPEDTRPATNANYARYIDYVKGQLRELLTNYGPIDILWFNGGWEHTAAEHRATELVDFIRGLQPNIIINDGLGVPGDYHTIEQSLPAAGVPNRDWELAMTINDSWGYNKTDHNWKSDQALIDTLADVGKRGGNLLLNVGPTAEGRIPQPSIERLQTVGRK